MRVRGELRRRWRAWVSLGLILGFAGGVVVASLAGARRTESAYPRFLRESDAADLLIFGPPGFLDFEEVGRLPQVEESATVDYVALYTDRETAPDSTAPNREAAIQWFVPPDGMYTELSRPAVISGRRPRAAHEIAVNPSVADAFELELGDTLHVRALAPEEIGELLVGNEIDPDGPEFDLKVVGVEVASGEFIAISEVGTVHMSPDFLAQHGDDVARVPGFFARLRNGEADLDSFRRGVERMTGGASVEIVSADYQTGLVQRGVRIIAQTLRLFALLAGLAAAFIGLQTLTRHIFSEADDYRPLSALGFTRIQLWGAAMLHAASVAAVAGAVTVATAVAISPLFPLGTARVVEPSPGFDFDVSIVGGGAVTVILAFLLLAAAPAWRVFAIGTSAETIAQGAVRVGRLRGALIRMSASPAAVAGVSMATDSGEGRRAVPVRSAIAGCAGAIAGLVLAFTLGSSLDRLIGSPELYGWRWDAVFGSPYGGDLVSQAGALDDLPQVESYSTVGFAQLEVDGSTLTALAFGGEKGVTLPPIIEGRAPRIVDEIVVGKKVVRRTGSRIGDVVTVVSGELREEKRIVGFGVFPALGRSEITGLGEGALFTEEGLRRLIPDYPRNLVALRFAPDIDQRDGIVAVREALEGASLHATLETPVEVGYFEELERLPMLLAGLLVIVATTTLGHTLVSTVRRRRREVAILKTLGFVREQVLSTLSWQSTTLILLALVTGIPAGLIAGRVAWQAFADNLGILPASAIPWAALIIAVPSALLIANLVAAFPARSAADTEPGIALRSL